MNNQKATAHGRRRSIGRRWIAAVSAVLVAAGLGTVVGLAASTVSAADDVNVARLETGVTSAAIIEPTWNSLSAINDGNNNPTALSGMWGTWSGSRPAQVWVSYTFDEPVSIDKTVVYWWRDATSANGENVWAPASWKMQYQSSTVTTWTDVPNPSAYGIETPVAVSGTVARPTQIPNTTTFDRITATQVRLLINAQQGGANNNYAAVSITEWEVWGQSQSGPPPSSTDPIAVDEIHIPTTVGTLPTLPEAVWATYVDGIRVSKPTTWATVAPAQVAAAGSFTVSGEAADISQPVTATVHVREVGATPALIDFLPQSALTVAGTAPQLPPTALGLYDDGSVDSRLAVTWDAIPSGEYAQEGLFSVLGTVSGTSLRPEILVIVDAPGAGGAPVVGIETAPEQPASGWQTGNVTVTITASSDIDPNPAIEYRIGDGDWTGYTAPFEVTEDGEHVIGARATDLDGQTSAEQDITVKIDTTAPDVTADTTDGPDEVTVELSATDALSGVQSIQYQVGEEFTATYAGSPVGIAKLGEPQTVRYFATDLAGNVSADQTFVVPAKAITEPTFSDVPASNPFFDAIEWAAGTGVTTGYADGTFRPADDIRRDAVAAMVFRAMNPGAAKPLCVAAPFADVPSNQQFCGEITWLKDQGITTGYADGTYRPTATISRDAMAAFMARAYGPAEIPACGSERPFTDVAVSHPFCKEIGWLKAEGITTGFPDGTFRPSLPIERQAFVAYLYRVQP